MHCVKSASRCEELVKKSRFIGAVYPCDNEAAVQAALHKLAQEHPQATHIAYAWRLKTAQGIIYRFSDAGEPAGTAGKPIYQHLEGKQIVNVLVAVVRYFGGIKLGAGGLVRAYGGCAKLALEQAQLAEYVEYAHYQVALDYAQLQAFQYQLQKLEGEIIRQAFGSLVDLEIRLPVGNADVLLASSASLCQSITRC